MSPASYQTAPPRDVYFTASSQLRDQVLPLRAGNGTRTRDPNLGKVVLYQLSYSRERLTILMKACIGLTYRLRRHAASLTSGGEGDRTPDLVNAIHALSQLSYAPLLYCRALGRGGSTET